MVERSNNFSYFLISSGATTFSVTYLASRGSHSKLHSKIAQFAMGVETTNILVGVGLRMAPDDSRTARVLTRLGKVGMGLTAACFFAVPITDTRIQQHRGGLKELSGILVQDFKRHMFWGFREILSRDKPHS